MKKLHLGLSMAAALGGYTYYNDRDVAPAWNGPLPQSEPVKSPEDLRKLAAARAKRERKVAKKQKL